MEQEIKIPELQLIISYPIVDYLDWKFLNNKLQNIDKELNDLLNRLDIRNANINSSNKSIKYNTDSFTYKNNINTFYWLLLHIDNPFEYNKYFDRLLTIHSTNLKYKEVDNKPATRAKKERTVKRYKAVNKWFREIKIDIFTNKERYCYYNPKTKEEFISDNPDELDRLNAKLIKKEKKIKKSKDIPKFNNIVFNFNKKNDG